MTHRTAQGTICIVDDDASVRRSLIRVLHSAGYDVLTCDSAEAFLSIAEVPRPICLLVDVGMPGMDGIDLQIALARAGRDLPVVVISGHAGAPEIARALAAGALSCLAKPVEARTLFQAVERGLALDRERLEHHRPAAPASDG
jgi:FixJ family two-component response regulator